MEQGILVRENIRIYKESHKLREENSRLREKLQVFQFRLETLLVDLKAEDNEPSPTLEASTDAEYESVEPILQSSPLHPTHVQPMSNGQPETNDSLTTIFNIDEIKQEVPEVAIDRDEQIMPVIEDTEGPVSSDPMYYSLLGANSHQSDTNSQQCSKKRGRGRPRKRLPLQDSVAIDVNTSKSSPTGKIFAGKKNVYTCKHCSFTSHKVYSVKRHQRQVHKDFTSEALQCGQCDYSTTHRKNLLRHQKIVHEGARHPCQQCSYVGANQRKLEHHIRRHHDPDATNITNNSSPSTGGVKNPDGQNESTLPVPLGEDSEKIIPGVSASVNGDNYDNYENVTITPIALLEGFTSDEDDEENTDGGDFVKSSNIEQSEGMVVTPETQENFQHFLLQGGPEVPSEHSDMLANNHVDVSLANSGGHQEPGPTDTPDYRFEMRAQMFNCQFCTFRAKSTYAIKRHQDSVHFGRRDIKFKCDYCEFIGRDSYSLRRHTSSKHT